MPPVPLKPAGWHINVAKMYFRVYHTSTPQFPQGILS
jgi:hypothetical protein